MHDNGANDSTLNLGLLRLSDMLTGRKENSLIRKKVIEKDGSFFRVGSFLRNDSACFM